MCLRDSFGDKNHNMIMSSQTRKQMQGPRPAPLTVSRSSTKIIKKKLPVPAGRSRSPVIIYLKSPTVIHVRPEEFRDTVQRLTGRNRAPSTVIPDSAHHSYSSPTSCGMVADHANMGRMGISSSFWSDVDLCMLSGLTSLRRAFDDIV